MNKILVKSNKISNDTSGVEIKDNVITFLEDGKYFIEYDECDNTSLVFQVMDGKNVVLYEYSFDNKIIVNNKYVIHGYLIVNKFYNNDSVKEYLDIDLCSDRAQIDYNFSNICKVDEYYEMNINHNHRNTISNISNKSVALNNSKLNFVINSRVKKEYEKSKLNQNTRIITIGKSDAKICPNMFIDCEDVEAKHGSIIGTFKEDMVFYLMSRGIRYNEAIKLLIKGYLFSNIQVDSDLRNRIMDVIDLYWR